MTLAEALREVERRLVLRTLRATGGSRREAAALLDVTETTVSRLVERHRLERELARIRRRSGWSPTAAANAAWRALHAPATSMPCGANAFRFGTGLVCALPSGHHGGHNTAADGTGDTFVVADPA